MVFSNARKLTLSAWLKTNREREYNNPLKLQKFLFFYEAFAKVDGDNKADFDHLRGYKNGPVFSNVWGDYTKERCSFERCADVCFEKYGDMIDCTRALQCSFIVSILSERELSALTHKMNIWKAKEELINNGTFQVSLDVADFNQSDFQMIEILKKMYSVDMIKSSEIISMDNFYFIVSKENFTKLTEEHFDTLTTIIQGEGSSVLHNPVFIEVDTEGVLMID